MYPQLVRLSLQTIDCEASPSEGPATSVDNYREDKGVVKVRHVRMLGISLVAAFTVAGIAAGPALAKKASNPFEKFNECPLQLVQENGCIFGEAGKESFFQAGKVTVHFVKPVKLNIGFTESEEHPERENVWGAEDGHSITKEPEPAPSLTEGIDTEKLSEAEKARYEAYLASGGSTKVTATIELALPASDIFLDEANLLEEEGESFGFPVMIHLSNKFLGTKCYVGNTTEPINVPFTTGETHPEAPNTPIHGTLGHIVVIGEGQILEVEGPHLVNNEYAAPGVGGCGINGSLDESIDSALGLPSPAGSNTTELIGNLFQAGAGAIDEHIKF